MLRFKKKKKKKKKIERLQVTSLTEVQVSESASVWECKSAARPQLDPSREAGGKYFCRDALNWV